jgi:hypothetical protein
VDDSAVTCRKINDRQGRPRVRALGTRVSPPVVVCSECGAVFHWREDFATTPCPDCRGRLSCPAPGRSRPVESANVAARAGWYPVNDSADEIRWWNGKTWTDHRRRTPVDRRESQIRVTTSASNGSTASRRGGAEGEGEGLVKLLASYVGWWLADLIVWLAPVVALGGLGALLIASGTERQQSPYGESHMTAIHSTGWLGGALVCVAVAMFFGRGTVQSLVRVVTGKGGFRDVLFFGASIRWLLISAAAIAGAAICIVLAITT